MRLLPLLLSLILIPACHSIDATSDVSIWNLERINRNTGQLIPEDQTKADVATPFTNSLGKELSTVSGFFNFSSSSKKRTPLSGEYQVRNDFVGSEQQLASYLKSAFAQIQISKTQGIKLTTTLAIPTGLEWKTDSLGKITATLFFVFTPNLPEGRVDEHAVENDNVTIGHYTLIFGCASGE